MEWEEADYIVVGAGPAGSALAARVADRPDRPTVLLVEAGPAKPSFLSVMPVGIAALVPRRNRHNYAFVTVPQPGLNGRSGYVPRGRGVGGSSLINAMIYVRGQPEDYDGWLASGCRGWGWADVLPLFRRSEANGRGADAWHGDTGPLHVSDLVCPHMVSRDFVAAAAQCGYPVNDDFNGAQQEGVGLYQVFQRNGRRFDAGRAYLDRPRANLKVLTDAKVHRVAIESRRATGVIVADHGRERRLRARREVILSAGAIGSPQILMLSGIGPANDLLRLGIPVVRDVGGVGANLQDHLDYAALVRMRMPGLFGLGVGTLMRMALAGRDYRAGRGRLTSNVSEAGGFLRSPLATTNRPDIQLHFCTALVEDHGRRRHIATGTTLHVCGLRPESRGASLSPPPILPSHR